MTRKQKNWTFWILVFSLNLIPLVAQGKAGAPTGRKQKKPAAAAPAAPATAVAPVAKDVPPPAPKYSGEARDLTLADLTNPDVIRDFDSSKDAVAEPGSSAILKGTIFAKCQSLLTITHMEKAPGCGSDAAFKIRDNGGFVACMAARKAVHCSEDKNSENACVFISDVYPNAKYDLSALGKVDIQLMHHNPDGNVDHQNVCEQFKTPLHHTDQATIDAKIASDASANKAARIDVAQTQVKSCVHSESELKTAYRACSVLALLGEYKSQSECVAEEKLDQHGIDILRAKALHGTTDQLDGVANQLISWANKHPKECKKAIEPLHTIAKRLATQKSKRTRNKDDDSDSGNDPLAGFDAANDVLQNAIDGASCLDQDGKLSEMQQNLAINRTEKVGEIKGMYSMEYRQDYADLMSNLQSNMTDNCNSWEMDTSCSAATKDMQSAMTVSQMVNASNMKQAQSNAALCQMVMRSSNGTVAPPQCQQGAMGGMLGMNGLGYGGISSSSYGFGRL